MGGNLPLFTSLMISAPRLFGFFNADNFTAFLLQFQLGQLRFGNKLSPTGFIHLLGDIRSNATFTNAVEIKAWPVLCRAFVSD